MRHNQTHTTDDQTKSQYFLEINQLPLIIPGDIIASHRQWLALMQEQQAEIAFLTASIQQLKPTDPSLQAQIATLAQQAAPLSYPLKTIQAIEAKIVDINSVLIKKNALMIDSQTLKITGISRLTQVGITYLQQQFNIPNIHTLLLSGNHLKNIPSSIHIFKNVSMLVLTKNAFSHFPMQILQLSNLSMLKISENNLSTIPNEIMQLQKLGLLDCSTNKITDIPEELASLPELRYVTFAHNCLTRLPSALIKQVRSLDLTDNMLPRQAPLLLRPALMRLEIADITGYIKGQRQQPPAVRTAAPVRIFV